MYVEGDDGGTMFSQDIRKACMEGTRPFGGITREGEVVGRIFIHRDDYDIPWRYPLTPYLEKHF